MLSHRNWLAYYYPHGDSRLSLTPVQRGSGLYSTRHTLDAQIVQAKISIHILKRVEEDEEKQGKEEGEVKGRGGGETLEMSRS